MTQDKEVLVESRQYNEENAKQRDRKEKNFQTKVVIRRLPPTMTELQFLEQIDPVPENDYFYFVRGDMSLGVYAFSRAYISFVHQEDIFIFKDKFDGYVFIDNKGNEYPAVVEFAPFQKIPKKRAKKKDPKCGTIEQDPDYLKFLESVDSPDESPLPSAETYLEEIEARERELKANSGVPKVTTPLIEYLKQRKLERQKMREEKREDRKRRDLERKRIREDERRRKKEQRTKENAEASAGDETQQSETAAEAQGEALDEQDSQQAPVLKVLKNPEREKTEKGKNVRSGGGGRRETQWELRDRQRTRERAAAARERERIKRTKDKDDYSTGSKQPQGERLSQPVKGFATKGKGASNRQQKIPTEEVTQQEDVKGDSGKDPRLDRRIRNKDRPSLEIYRPGMRKMSTQKESNASTPSPSVSPTQQEN